MHDIILNQNDIYLQDIVCDETAKHIQETDFEIYNRVVELVEVTSIESVEKILHLIKLNRAALS